MRKERLFWVLFTLGIVMNIGADTWSRFAADAINWYTVGVIVSVIAGCGILIERYFDKR